MIASIAASLALASAVPSSDQAWSFEIMPYYWSASLRGDLTIDGQKVETEGGGDGFFGDPALGGFLGHFEARCGPWAFAYEPIIINADLPGGQPPATAAALSIHAEIHEAFIAHEIAEHVDCYVGARYFDLRTDMDLSIAGVPLSSHQSERSWIDPIVGVRYDTHFDERWSLRARADVGGFGVGSAFEWNAEVLAGYHFSSTVGLHLGYRVLSLDFNDGSGSDRLEYNLTMYGPIIGLSFSF
jgi:hypothetical protein